GYTTPYELMLSTATSKVGAIANAGGWTMKLAAYTRYGSDTDLSSVSAVTNNKDTKFYILQGDKDPTVGSGSSSLAYSLKDQNLSNATVTILENKTHQNLFFSDEANAYVDSLKKTYYPMSKEEKEAFLSTVDKEKASEVNAKMMEGIKNFLLSSL
nr:hypothetical protein [Bacilli bacterium]